MSENIATSCLLYEIVKRVFHNYFYIAIAIPKTRLKSSFTSHRRNFVVVFGKSDPADSPSKYGGLADGTG